MWQTYQQVHDMVMNIGSALRRRGINPVSQIILYESDNAS
jgi:uncharacterized protein (UPF0297 family)